MGAMSSSVSTSNIAYWVPGPLKNANKVLVTAPGSKTLIAVPTLPKSISNELSFVLI